MSLADAARGAYARAPLWLRSTAGQLMAQVPTDVLYGPAYRSVSSDIDRAATDERFCASRRERLLRDALIRASRATAYSSRLATIDLEDVRPFDVLERLPVLERAAVAHDPAAYLCRPAASMDLVTTGGTGGTPLSFYLDRDRSPREWAFINAVWSAAGYRPGDRRAVLRGIEFGGRGRTSSWDPALRELALSPFELTNDVMSQHLELLTTYRIQWIHGYPSAVSALCAFGANVHWQPPETMKGVLLISEPVYAHQRHLIQNVLPGRPILPFYGQSERVAIAREMASAPDTYEFEPLYGIAELLDDYGQRVATQGGRGRLVGTGFISRGMPLLRYDTGDSAELVEHPGPANGHRLIVRSIWGRWPQEFLVGRAGNLISMTALNIHSTAYSTVRQFQFYQDTPGVAVMRVVPLDDGDTSPGELLLREFAAKVSRVLELRVQVVSSLETTIRGKQAFIDQRLPIHHPDAQSDQT
jgi:phenylacetate-CoA ligase